MTDGLSYPCLFGTMTPVTRFCPKCEAHQNTRVETWDEHYECDKTFIVISITSRICVACGEALGNDEMDQAIIDTVQSIATSVGQRKKGLTP